MNNHYFKDILHNIFTQNANKIILKDENISLTGSECLEICNHISETLNKNDSNRKIIGILLKHNVSQGILFLAILYSNNIPVVINEQLPISEKKIIIKKLSIEYLLQYDVESDLFVESNANYEIKNHYNIFINHLSLRNSNHGLLDDIAVIIVTSGSTGVPKAARHSFSSITYMIDEIIKIHNVNNQTIAALVLPIFFSMGLVTQFLPTVFSGGTSIFIGNENVTNKFYKKLQNNNATNLAIVPDVLYFLLKEIELQHLEMTNSIKSIQLSGGFIHQKHIDIVRKIFPNAIIHKGYGSTEALRITSISSEDKNFDVNCVGRPLSCNTVKILDEHGNEVDRGQTGKIFVKGKNLMIDYYDKDDSFNKNGLFDTGDYGKMLDDDLLHVEGRKDGMFKILGKKVSCKEIEESISSCLKFKNVICLPVEYKFYINKPVLFIECLDDIDNIVNHKINEIIENFKKNLLPYKIPKQIVLLEQFPRLNNGKTNRVLLKNEWSQNEKNNKIKSIFGINVYHLQTVPAVI